MIDRTTQDTMTDSGVYRSVPPKSKSLKSVQTLMAAICGIGGILLLVYISIDRSSSVITARGFGYAAAMFVSGGLGFTFMWLWRRNVRLLIGAGQVGYQDIFGRRHFWLKGQIDRALDVIVIYTKSAQPRRAIYLIGADGKRVLALNPRAWSEDDARDFIEASGAAVDRREQPINAADVRKQFPGAFGWGSQHVALGTTITIILALALAVGVFVLWAWLAGR